MLFNRKQKNYRDKTKSRSLFKQELYIYIAGSQEMFQKFIFAVGPLKMNINTVTHKR